jgi:hypothetical protein
MINPDVFISNDFTPKMKSVKLFTLAPWDGSTKVSWPEFLIFSWRKLVFNQLHQDS